MIVVCLISTVLLLPIFTNGQDTLPSHNHHVSPTSCIKNGVLNWISCSFIEEVRNVFPLATNTHDVEGRKKKGKLNKYVVPLLIGFLLIKSILLPIALKALAVLSGKAVILSLMSLILASIVGLKKIAHSSEKSVDIVTVPVSKYRRKDMLYDWEEAETDQPFGYYQDRAVEYSRRTKSNPAME